MSLNALQFQLEKCHALQDSSIDQRTLFAAGRTELYMGVFHTIEIIHSPLGNRQIENVTHKRLATSKGAGSISSMPLPDGTHYELLAANKGPSTSQLVEIVSKGNDIVHASSLGMQNHETLGEIYKAMHAVSKDPEALKEFTKYTNAMGKTSELFIKPIGPTNQPRG